MSLEPEISNKFDLTDLEVELINEFQGICQLILTTTLNTDDCDSTIKRFLDLTTICKQDFYGLSKYDQKEIDYYSSPILSELFLISKNPKNASPVCYSRITYDYIKKHYPDLIKLEMSFNHNDKEKIEEFQKKLMSITKLELKTYRYKFYRTDTDFKPKLDLFESYNIDNLIFTTDAFNDVVEIPKTVLIQVSKTIDIMDNWDIQKYPCLKQVMLTNKFRGHFVKDVVIRDDLNTFMYLLSLENIDMNEFVDKYKYNLFLVGIQIAMFLGKENCAKIYDLHKDKLTFNNEVKEYIFQSNDV